MIQLTQRSLAGRLSSFFCMIFLCGAGSSLQAKTLIFESGGTPKPTENTTAVIAPSVSSKTVSTTQLSRPNSANAELFFMIEQLKQEVSELRGLVEQQAFQLRNLEVAGKRRYQDLDARVLAISQQLGAPGTSAPAAVSHVPAGSLPSKLPEAGIVPAAGQAESAPAVASPPVSEEQKQAYAKAYSLVKQKSFEEAVDSLHSYIERYPEGELTGNAYYWLGEVYLVLPKLEQAKQSFMIVVKTFPGHRKVADSMFKLAVTYDRLLDPVNSEKYLELVQKSFPNSTASKLAKSYKINR